MVLTPSEASRLLAAHGRRPSRALGQNFVVDPNTVRRIARLAGVGPGDHVVEVGAGLGSLTLALAETGAEVTAVEIDRHLVEVLEEVLPERAPDVRIVAGDAMALDWAELLAGADRWVLVANLPYNVATPLVLDLLDDVPAIERMLVMVQLEAGQRLVAGVGDAAYGIPSVKVAFHARAEVVGTVSPNVFLPKPKVESALVSIVRHPDGPAADAEGVDPERLFTLVRAGFGQRRKMLRRSLAGLLDEAAIDAAGVDPQARAENLTLAQWAALARQAPSEV
jgi:16S rRNA (adenine1518-N6/adenine1519-N6)-dimethyltransferase